MLKAAISNIKNSIIFHSMSEDEIVQCLTCCSSRVKTYEKDEMIFKQEGKPKYLYVLIDGAVSICKDSLSGKKSLITGIQETGELFGEVFIFIENQKYDYYAVANSRTTVLMIPREAFYNTCSNTCDYHKKLIRNMLSILAYKAYFLNSKLQLLSAGGLRQKLAKYMLDNQTDGYVPMYMNREEFADYLNVARPSLSRELLKMQEEGIITIGKKNIHINQMKHLEFEMD